MKEVKGNVQSISYEVDCPSCGETSYSDVNSDEWASLEWGDGYPYGVLECGNCSEEYHVTINH